jgi:hypothetical protein
LLFGLLGENEEEKNYQIYGEINGQSKSKIELGVRFITAIFY